jgi:hypothetical protein
MIILLFTVFCTMFISLGPVPGIHDFFCLAYYCTNHDVISICMCRWAAYSICIFAYLLHTELCHTIYLALNSFYQTTTSLNRLKIYNETFISFWIHNTTCLKGDPPHRKWIFINVSHGSLTPFTLRKESPPRLEPAPVFLGLRGHDTIDPSSNTPFVYKQCMHEW